MDKGSGGHIPKVLYRLVNGNLSRANIQKVEIKKWHHLENCNKLVLYLLSFCLVSLPMCSYMGLCHFPEIELLVTSKSNFMGSTGNVNCLYLGAGIVHEILFYFLLWIFQIYTKNKKHDLKNHYMFLIQLQQLPTFYQSILYTCSTFFFFKPSASNHNHLHMYL